MLAQCPPSVLLPLRQIIISAWGYHSKEHNYIHRLLGDDRDIIASYCHKKLDCSGWVCFLRYYWKNFGYLSLHIMVIHSSLSIDSPFYRFDNHWCVYWLVKILLDHEPLSHSKRLSIDSVFMLLYHCRLYSRNKYNIYNETLWLM